jgi:predicted transcriptional regulator
MARPRGNRKTTRLTVSLDEHAHTALSAFAKRQDVSVAWMVRRAVSEFIDRQERPVQSELPLRRASIAAGR